MSLNNLMTVSYAAEGIRCQEFDGQSKHHDSRSFFNLSVMES